MNAAVYAGTRNLYHDMITAAKSLAKNSYVDVIYFLIEDDPARFPEKLPDYVKCVDVSNQRYFSQNGPNVYRLWTWMVLMRAALSKVFPQHDQILSLDIDTIVDRNINLLWQLNLENYYVAGVKEPLKSNDYIYINNGVAVYNLDKLRTDCMDSSIIYSLNSVKYRFAEQDCINKLCRGRIFELPSMYNANEWTEPCENPAIVHYAGRKDWRDEPLVVKYKNMSWDDIRKE